MNRYLSAIYRDGARGEEEGGAVYLDCWGLVRAVRHEVYGLPLLPSWGDVRNTEPAAFTRAYRAEAEQLELCRPEPGAIAAAFRGSLCLHVGVVVEIDGRLAVLDINPKRNAAWQPCADFESRFSRVLYYRDPHDRNLREQAVPRTAGDAPDCRAPDD